MADAKDQEKGASKRSAKGAALALTHPESHAALARKYRPRVFAELIGQEAMVRTLKNAFASGRIAQAYMLTGVRGVGKTTTARLIARALNYEAPGVEGPTLDIEAEGVHCRAILESRHLDVVEMDAASHTGIDDIRELIDSAHYKPNIARYKVYILDEVHMLSKPAFAGLLKTLEEPPARSVLLLVCHAPGAILPTIRSRCRRLALRPVSDDLVKRASGADDALVKLAKGRPGRAIALKAQGLDAGGAGEGADVERHILERAERPEAHWGWVEGDDPRVSWRELPEFFRQFDTGDAVGGADGFVLIPPSARNRDILSRKP